jgi:N-carbamoyl-L-amino-acid hydrolase
VQGVRQYRIDETGKAAHAGTTPMDMRRDAFVAACRIAAGLSAEFTHDDERTRFTIGRMRVLPGAPNTVPEKASFTVDLRHPDPSQLAEYDARISTVAAREASPCAVAVEPLISLEPVVFNPGICDLITRSARHRGLSVETLLSGATHDAANMATVTKTGMIFIPCRDGISHHEDEHAEPADMIAGANVLFDVILALAEVTDDHAAIAAPALI